MKKFQCKNSVEKCRNWILKDPTKIIRYIVLLICCIVVTVQLTECFLKLNDPPKSTHSHYELNDTMYLPALTVCREPPYKPDVLKKYKLPSHPKYYQGWTNFPFDTVNVSDVFLESTYTSEEILIQYGLSGSRDLINISSNLHFERGMCHTFRGIQPTRSSSRGHGYSIMLQHDMTREQGEIFDMDVGWHIYIHELEHDFTEMQTKMSARVEYMFLNVEEEIEIKLQTQFYSMMKDGDTVCYNNPGYSTPKCGELCIWKDLTGRANCSGPWMPDIRLPTCNNYTTMSNLITEYCIFYDAEVEPPCNCPDPCQSTLYSAFVMNRKELIQPRPSTQIWLYYTSKLVTIIEERPGYDLSQFVADIGGSIGFLLGLSVLGFIEIFEKLAGMLLVTVVKRRKVQPPKEDDDEVRRTSYEDSNIDITMDIATITGANSK